MASNVAATVAKNIFLAVERTGMPFDRNRLQSALQIARDVYGEQPHWSGERLIEHAAGVLEVLLPFQPDEDAVIACLLHHVLGLGEWTLVDIEEQFGPKVRSLVSGVHLLSHVTVENKRRPIEDLRVMLLSVSDDIRTILIALCDRCHLLDRIDRLPSQHHRRVSLDALQLFAPVAARLGIYSIKHRMESQAFPVLYPSDAERLHALIARLHGQHGDFLPNTAERLREELANRGLTPLLVVAREKHPYSLFTKMRQKSVTDITHIYDFYACRVVLQTIEQCYQALGIIHQIGRPISHRFKDYISFPKPNGYQSLHTTVAQLPEAPDDMLIEVQVRTEQMHREAEFGIAAHWSYKSYGSTLRAMEQAQLQQLITSQSVSVLESDDESPRLADHIFVLSPKGDIIELPEGATPLDFAFQVHTDLGLSFRGARVNGSMVPIDHELENGDVVEILRNKEPKPSTHWFQFLRLSSARSKLKRYLYRQDRPALIAQGRQLVNELFRRYHLPPLDQDMTQLKECDGQVLSFQEREDLLMKLGQGSERVSALFDRLEALRGLPHAKGESEPVFHAHEGELVAELEDGVPMPTRFAKCCKPQEKRIPEIVGVVSRAGIVIIHGRGCGMLRNANPARQIGAKWKTSL